MEKQVNEEMPKTLNEEVLDKEKNIRIPAAEPAFTKGQLLKSKKYADQRDLLDALLKEDRQYTGLEVQVLINEFMKGAV